MAESLWLIPFGKYKGKPIEDVTESYLEWLVEQEWFLSNFKDGAAAIGEELVFRNRFGGQQEQVVDQNWNRCKK